MFWQIQNEEKVVLVTPVSFKSKTIKNITEYLSPSAIIFLDACSRDVAISKLVDQLVDCYGLEEHKEAFYQAVLHREEIASTGIGMGVALPHAKLPDFDDFFIAIGFLNEGIDWKAIDGQQVKIIFLIAGPDDKQCDYLNLLSQLTLVLRDQDLRKQLLTATHAHQIMDIFKSAQEEA